MGLSRRVELKFTLKSGFTVGFFGGLYLAAYEIAMVAVKDLFTTPTIWDVVKMVAWPMSIYAVFAALVTAGLSAGAWLSARSGGVRLSQKQMLAVEVAVFMLLATTLMIAGIFGIGDKLRRGYVFHLVYFTGLAALVGYFVAMKVLSWFSLSKIVKRGLALSLAFFSVWLLALWWTNNFMGTKASLKVENRQSESKATEATKPNILWIVMDTARADHLSVYGYKRQTTPFLERFAQESVVYTNAISPAPWTLPAHASMLTGLFPSKHGADGSWEWLGEDLITVQEVFQARGYTTAAFSNNPFISPEKNFDQGFDTFVYWQPFQARELVLARFIRLFISSFKLPENFLRLSSIHRRAMVWDARSDAGAERTNRAVKLYLKEALSKQRPFFVLINYMEAHDPYGDTPEAGDYLGELGMNLKQAKAHRDSIQDVFLVALGKTQLDEPDKQLLSALYDADIKYLDMKIGELVGFLRQQAVLDNTVVIITSDHGENLGERNKIRHFADIHRSLTHVPLIIRYPPLFSPGERLRRIVQLTDIFPTLLDIAKIDDFARDKLQGYSLLNPSRPQLAISEGKWKQGSVKIKELFDRFPEADQRLVAGGWNSWQTETYEYIDGPKQDYLYNLRQDPGEQANIISQLPGVASSLRQQLIDWQLSFTPYWGLF